MIHNETHIPSAPGADTLAQERDRLVRFCARFVGSRDAAEDLAQEALLEALRGGSGLRDRSAWRAWLTGIARNVCLRYRRTAGRERERRAETDDPQTLAEIIPANEDEDPLRLLERTERESLLDRAMAVLPPGTRELLVQRYIEELPPSELGARHRLTESNLNTRLHRSRNALRQILLSEPFRHEAAAHGLRWDGPGADGWQQTAVWCPRCGAHHLEARFSADDDTPRFAVRCPSCRRNLGGDFTTDHPGLDARRVLGGVKAVKPALTRLHRWWHDWEQRAVGKGSAACYRCGRPAAIQFTPPPGSNPKYLGIVQFYAVCPQCGSLGGPSSLGRAMVHPEVQQFWRRYPRIRGTWAGTVRLDNGTDATLCGFESVTGGARIELLYANADARLLDLRREGDGAATADRSDE